MKYEELLHPWVIVRELPNTQNLSVKRFRHRNDANEWLKATRRLSSNRNIIMFDISARTGKQD